MQKTRVFLFGLIFCLSLSVKAQDVFIINEDTLQLNREVKGTLSLFWAEEGNQYRYFVQKKNRMVELLNPGGNQQYKEQLSELTEDAEIKTRDVQFVLYSLRHFTNSYNSLVEANYIKNESTKDIRQRISLFTGFSNNIYTDNPKNILAPVAGIEYELYDPNLAPRHSAFLQLRHNFDQDDYRYSATHLSVNYRFKALRYKNFDLHVNARLATLYYSKETISLTNEMGEVVGIKEDNGFTFTAPLSFGIGSDIKVTPKSFLTLGYNDIFAIVLEGNGKFPLDFTVGYKYNL